MITRISARQPKANVSTPLAKFVAAEQRRALEDHMLDLIRANGFPEPIREYPFTRCIRRKHQADFAWVDRMIILEVEGGSQKRDKYGRVLSRHLTPLGYRNDCEKYSIAAALGWKVIRATSDMIHDGTAIKLLSFAFYGGEYQKEIK